MATEQQLKEIQDSLKLLLAQNQEMSTKITELEKENKEIKKNAGDVQTRIDENKAKWVEMDKAAGELFKEMVAVQVDLMNDKVGENFFLENTTMMASYAKLTSSFDTTETDRASCVRIKQEPEDNETPGIPFDSVGKEERIDIFFGQDGDYSAVSMRRFIERFKVVKELNMRAKLRGWDSPSFRAGKLKLCLVGDAFDFVSLASSICKEWTTDDLRMIERLRGTFTNIQAIELNILEFERSSQETKESIGDYMNRLQRTVKEAYDGDSQRDLDRKVAWKFVSGQNDESIRRKLLEDGWMKTRQEAKPLEDLLKTAEVAKKTDDAVKALGKESGNVNATEEYMTVNAWERSYQDNNRKKRFSNESSNSKSSSSSRGSGTSGSSDMPLDFLECFYCKKKHRRGWFHCSLRKKEAPTWRPSRRGDSSNPERGKADFRR